jgi:hypothetical protein
MEGITTAIVVFIFVCILFPRLVKHRTQFYAAFLLILVLLFFESLAGVIGSDGFSRFVHGMSGFVVMGCLVLLVLATGGLSLKDLTGEFKSAIEVIRRGEEDREVIVPLTGEMPKPRRTTGAEASPVQAIPTPETTADEKKAGDVSSIPLE